ncbi:hypothetical protein [Paenibacillus sinopodophylli]|uniref:hypothetical protein n=1 Tax=Paenibacillus sinopodophylli TaxID=1837342 RepID=UPI00110CC51D|nr:hypothetical protein [Paenibacillus sinopodophylli]
MFNWVVSFINTVIRSVGAALVWVIALFPTSPFGSPSSPPSSVNLGWITWLIDFPTMIVHLVSLLGIIILYYIVRIAARWLKVVKD